ncbi:hypothetical protein AMAG_02008 [Allomyces macrogynus ATCC 38327]|uniref:Ribosomal RNA-processing protein 40 n=1 Tax=Allomyces macrogynus (strain ATCC 38327) TaxID=578462 RepID=A0A0L0S0S4_ALLM3|nr:hypothetical protein AMAG_02008 [Allomyces macrogynus ATCC 38327]|eukprot:KNE56173.1 hypothetical protein AMAG_02008 [Allomyces macrogynus ATCC 38327]
MADAEYPKYVVPGDRVPCLEMMEDAPESGEPPRLRLGPGLVQVKDEIVAVKAGMLHHVPERNQWWIVTDQKRYVPAAGDDVVGVITNKLAEAYKVDIGSAHPAVLSYMAFEGASKRNRPTHNVGDLVYARVAVAMKDMDPEIECVNPKSLKANGYGLLAGGFVIKTSLAFARSMLDPNFYVHKALEKHFPAFETAVGQNGRIWIAAATPMLTIAIADALQRSTSMEKQEFEKYVKDLAAELKRSTE